MRNFRFVVAYDGTGYFGWQMQGDAPTIQGEMVKAIEIVTGRNTRPAASGRTDAGVHALGQVVQVQVETRLSAHEFVKALNANLPDQIQIIEGEEADPSFDAVRQAKWKLYRYVWHDGPSAAVFIRHYCWKVRTRLDVGLMTEAASHLIGTHDFRSFETNWPTRATSVRTVRTCKPTRFGDFVYLDVEANGFLYNMVRTISGTLYEVGRRKWEPDYVREVLLGGKRASAGRTAPAQGLFLVRVEY